MPRRKYGRLQKAIPPVKPEKCRYCKLGWNCPVHKKKVAPDEDKRVILQKSKKRRNF